MVSKFLKLIVPNFETQIDINWGTIGSSRTVFHRPNRQLVAGKVNMMPTILMESLSYLFVIFSSILLIYPNMIPVYPI